MNGVPWWFLHGLQGASRDARIQSVDKDGQMGKLIPIEQVIGCVVHASCSLNGPGFVKHHFGNDLIVGSPSGGETVRSLAVAAVLNRAGFASSVSERIQNDVWYKLWGNMTVNTVSAITGATTDAILDDDLIRGFMSRVMLEAKEIGARLGISISQEPDDRHAVTRKLGAFKTSMLQDVEAGRPTELDALVGAVKDLGEITAVATPFTDALFGLARLNLKLKKLY
jgi:2-dehydropantoate 2-reductase